MHWRVTLFSFLRFCENNVDKMSYRRPFTAFDICMVAEWKTIVVVVVVVGIGFDVVVAAWEA